MPATFRRVDLGFFDTAPLRFVSTEILPHRAVDVFAAIADDPSGWGDWFPGFSHDGRYVTPPPHGVGSTREVVMSGLRFRETILAWERPSRWAFHLDGATLPLARAFAEDYRIVDRGDLSVVQWTVALDPSPAVARAGRLGQLFTPRLFRRAMARLDRSLAAERLSG